MKNKMKKYLHYQFPWQFLMLIIFIQSSIGKIEMPDIEFEMADKVIHFIVFGILGLLTARGMKNTYNTNIQNNFVLLSISLSIIYGALDEIHQYFVPGRHATVWDWVADTLGVIFFVWIYYRIIRRRQSENEKLGKHRTVI